MKRVLLALVLLLAPRVARADEFKVIVHPTVAGTSVPKQALADIFLKKVTRWSDLKAITPVDQSLTSPVRTAFSKEVLGMATAAVTPYWMRRIASGQAPPPAKKSDAEVIAFVSQTPGAIGYVSPRATIPATVKLVEIR